MESAESHTAGYHRAVFVIEAEIQGFLAVFDISDISWLLLDSRVVDVPRSSNPIVVPLSSSNPLFFNGLKKAVHFSGNVGA
jgi:hypothetical protein